MKSKLSIYARKIIGMIVLPVLIFIIFAVVTGGRTNSWRMTSALLRQSVFGTMVAMALILNLTMGMLDFSVGGVLMAATIIGGNLMNMTGTGPAGLVVFCIVISIALTSFTGFIINKLKLPVIATTIGLVFVYEAIPRIIFENGVSISGKNGILAQSPYVFILFAFMYALFYVIYNYTTFGHNIRAVGYGPKLAKAAGVDVEKTKQKSFTLSGVFIGVASVLYISTNAEVTAPAPLASMAILFTSFLGMFLALFLSRYGNIGISLPVGIFTMTMLTNYLIAAGLPQTAKDILSGVFLFVLLAVSANQRRVVEWQASRKRARKLNKEIQSSLK